MRVLFTGASSNLGSRVLGQMLRSDGYSEIWCAQHRTSLEVSDPKVRVIKLDLTSDFDLKEIPAPIDLVVHFAGVTHATDRKDYFSLNHLGTMNLVRAARAQGCRRFVYVSTRCAVTGAGAYGESKLAAEDELQKSDWDSLLILRPSEVYGAGGKEGIDQLIALARRWHLAPMLFGNSRIEFAPLHIDDFAAIAVEAIAHNEQRMQIMEVCGPEDLRGPSLAMALAKRFTALPIPIWWPLLALFLRAGAPVGLKVTVPDQTPRLTCAKTSSARRADKIGGIRF